MVAPPPNPESWLTNWLLERGLVDAETLDRYVDRFLEQERRWYFQRDPRPPTLGQLLERDGLLTPEQREEGEREAARRQAEFMRARAEDMARDRPLPPPEV